MASVSVKRPPKSSESKADLVSIEAEGGSGGSSKSGGGSADEMFTWSRRTPTEKLLFGVVAVLVVALVAVIVVAATRQVLQGGLYGCEHIQGGSCGHGKGLV